MTGLYVTSHTKSKQCYQLPSLQTRPKKDLASAKSWDYHTKVNTPESSTTAKADLPWTDRSTSSIPGIILAPSYHSMAWVTKSLYRGLQTEENSLDFQFVNMPTTKVLQAPQLPNYLLQVTVSLYLENPKSSCRSPWCPPPFSAHLTPVTKGWAWDPFCSTPNLHLYITI